MKILQVAKYFKPCWQFGRIIKVVYYISKEISDRGREIMDYIIDGCHKRLEIPKNKPDDVDDSKNILIQKFFC